MDCIIRMQIHEDRRRSFHLYIQPDEERLLTDWASHLCRELLYNASSSMHGPHIMSTSTSSLEVDKQSGYVPVTEEMPAHGRDGLDARIPKT